MNRKPTKNFAASYLSHQQKLKETMLQCGANAKKQREIRENLKPVKEKDAKEG